MKILIVDDEPIVRKTIRLLLENIDASYEISDAYNGENAKDKIRESVPDLVLTDIVMPQADGIMLLKWLMTDYPQVRSLVLSSHQDFIYVKEAFVYGAINYVLKNEIDEESLAQAIQGAIKSRTGKREKSETDIHCSFYGCSKENLTPGPVCNELPVEITDLKEKIKEYIYFSDLSEARRCFLNLNRLIGMQTRLSVSAVKILYTNIADAIASKFAGVFREKNIDIYDMNMRIINAEKLNDIFEIFEDCFNSVFRWNFNLLDENGMSPMVRKIVEYINLHYFDSDLGLDAIAGIFKYSGAYVSRKFRTDTGVTIVDYINIVRISAAKQMILDSGMSLYRISEDVGYNNYTYFNKMFKKITGENPSAFADSIRN